MAMTVGIANLNFVCLLVFLWAGSCSTSTDFPGLAHIRTSTDPYVQAETVRGLIHRLIGSRSIDFTISVDPSLGPQDRDTFKLFSVGGQVFISGTSGVAAAMGFYYYLKQYCHAHVSWAGVQVALPETLPPVPYTGVTVTSNDRFRYYQNVCTVSYSFAWFNWSDWQRQLDWMGMQGINFPLAFNAQEAIWKRVFLKLGFNQSEIDNHFGGPAFLAWSRMGNMRGWGGPLSDAFHEQQVALQHKILKRMRGFGMIPILPAFAGHVPDGMKRLFPNASVSRLPDWGRFTQPYCCVLLLDFQDPLFKQIGKFFIREYTNEFGTDHVYNTDTFNEMTPKSGDPSYLAAAGRAVFEAMTEGDPQAVWVMQAWLFYVDGFWNTTRVKALLTAIPKGRLILLDLYSEESPQFGRFESYYGQPFIWCMLHDFGGTVAMYGDLNSINEGPFRGRAFPNSTMVGIGLAPEGIFQNEVVYEFMMENAWRTEPRNISKWLVEYATQRYGKYDVNMDKAWKLLQQTVYNCTSSQEYHAHGNNIISQRPTIYSRRPDVWYDAEKLFQAWDYFVQAADHLAGSSLFRYDLVDVTRQSLQVIGAKYYKELVDAFSNKDRQSLRIAGNSLLQLLSNLDKVLASDPHFLLGNWLESAKAMATNDADRKLFEYNARNQITLWGPKGNILDYANKQWAGVVHSYFRGRWKLFFLQLKDALKTGIAFNQTAYDEDVFRLIEEPFTLSRSVYPNRTKGDSVRIARTLNMIYRPVTIEDRAFFSQLLQLYHREQDRLRAEIIQNRTNAHKPTDDWSVQQEMLMRSSFHMKGTE